MDLSRQTIQQFLDSVAAKTPAPGGGAVAAMTGALAAALGQMVLNYSIGRKSLAAHGQLHADALQELQAKSHSMMELAREDALAYAAMNGLWRLDESDVRRQRDLPRAILNAIEPPRKMVQQSVEMLEKMQKLIGVINPNLASDLAVAAILAEAAARAAAWNVAINLPILDDPITKSKLESTVSKQISQARELCNVIEAGCRTSAS